MKVLRAALLCVLFLAAVFPSDALPIPPRPAQRVSDYANLLAAADRQTLEDALAAHERATTNQIIIAIFPSLEGESLEDFSMRLAEAWKPGQAGKDNGVLLAIFMQERKMRFEVGYGLEGVLPDVVCKRIIDEDLTPRFREQDFAGGLRAAVGRLGELAGDTALAGVSPASGRSSSQGQASPIVTFIVVLIFLLLFIAMVRAGLRSGGRRGTWSSGGGHRSGGFRSSGGGFRMGGGSFGGGGASGGW